MDNTRRKFLKKAGMATAAMTLTSSFLFGKSEEQKTNFLVFIADDVSWDDFGCYGNSEVKTPNIDRLAKKGLKCDNVYLTASSCSPSRNSILTGRYPHNTGAAELHTSPPDDMLSLPEVLKKNGYFTAHSGKFHMGKYIEKGFDVISRKIEEIGNSGSDTWLKTLKERPKDKPFFLWYAALDAHRAWGENQFSGKHDPEKIDPPFYLADGERTRKDMAQYYDEIYRFDYRIGEVVDELKKQGQLENTMIIIMSDNGRPFPHSKTRVNDRGMKTPFIVYWPEKIKKHAESKSLISAIDIAPTIIDYADVDIPDSFQGHSFAKLIKKPHSKFRNYVFAEHNWHDFEAHERMIRDENYMYILNSRPNQPQMGPADAIESPSMFELKEIKAKGELTPIQSDVFVTPRPKEELYDYREDPRQLINVASVPKYQDVLKKLRAKLNQWMDETGDSVPKYLTKDWYLREPGYIKTDAEGTRGEMPGAVNNATEINKKGPF